MVGRERTKRYKMRDLDKVGAAFGDYQMSFETLESPIAKDVVNILNLELQEKNHLAEQFRC